MSLREDQIITRPAAFGTRIDIAAHAPQRED